MGKTCKSNYHELPYITFGNKIDSLNLLNQLHQDHKKQLFAQIEKQTASIDSLKSVKQKVLIKYVEAKSKRSEITGDSIHDLIIFDGLAANCDSMNAINDSIISGYIERDSMYVDVIRTQEKQLSIKDTTNQVLTEELVKSESKVSKLEKKVKRNRVIAVCGWIVAGVMAVF